jgi:serine/threonine protein kinase
MDQGPTINDQRPKTKDQRPKTEACWNQRRPGQPSRLMLLCSGTRLGPYEIVAVLGAGGMGEVYRARDPRLGRDVAIKVRPASFSADPDRLRRFEQEARAAARLNHPNILTVHEIAAHDGQPYVVSELLEGETLRTVIERGPMPVKRAVDYAIQLCRGLAAAHEKGIVHRDLKPENVFVTKDGRVKILDFGSAKLTEAAAAGAETVLIGTHLGDTTPGLVVGTVGYMSPEQVRGQPVDHRSDIFNVGAILYELLGGTRAFAGATPADTLSDILGKDPPELPSGHRSVSPALDRIVRHCLEKVPSQRFQSASDVAFALENAGIPSEVPVSGAPAARPRPRWMMASVIAATARVATMITALIDRQRASAAIDHLSLTGVARLTNGLGFSDSPVWSPDGAVFAFSSNKSGNFEIYVRRVEGGGEINITKDPSEDVQPAFSPNGTEIAFVSTRSSKRRLVKIGVCWEF